MTRREFLNSIGVGFGGLAFNALAAGRMAQPYFVPRAKRVIFLFMHGGPSHIDLFDHKPALAKYNGKPLPFPERKVQFAARGNLMASPWKMRQVGASGLWMSELWQHLPKVADDLCMLHSVCETKLSHGGACMKMHCGDETLVRPSVGAWVGYGLGTANENQPGFVTICPTSLHGGANNFGPAFLPSIHGGVPLGTPGYPNTPAKQATFHYMKNPRAGLEEQRLQLELLRKLNEPSAADSALLEARIQSFGLAFKCKWPRPRPST